MNVGTYLRMVDAELLKLRRNRGVMAFALLLSAGAVIAFFAVGAIEHSSNPSDYQPVGGMRGYLDGVRVLGLFSGTLSAILVGAEAGTADRASGVFRDLAVTGRSRLALFSVRWPAAIIGAVAVNAVAYALVVIGIFAFAAGTPTPTVGQILQGAGWIALSDVVVAALAVGVGSLTGSRAVTLTGVIGWQAIVTSLLVGIPALGSAREVLLTPALGQLAPVPDGRFFVPMTTATAIIVVCGWLVASQTLGAWRTRTQDA